MSTAPQMRSMSWRDAPADARFTSSSTRLSNACVISSLVNAEYRARDTGASGFTSWMQESASLPMSSPSRSKSVAMMTESAFFARFFSERMISFSLGSFLMGAYTRYGSASIFQVLSSTPSSVKGFFFLKGGLGSVAGSFAGKVSPSSVTPCQPPRFLYTMVGVKSGSRMWPRRPMVTHSSPSTSKRYTGVEYTLSALGFLTPSKSAIF